MNWTVVVADQGLRELAAQWSAADLIGPSVWVDPADCSAATLEASDPVATVLPSGQTTSLMAFLAEHPETEGVRILWCRTEAVGAAADEAVAGMGALHGVLPGRIVKRDLFDILGPQPAGLESWPVKHPHWRTLIAGPHDAMVPGGVTELHLGDVRPLILHLACAVGGILGGRLTGALPVWGVDGALRTEVVDPFSSVLVGGQVLARAVDQFVCTAVPVASGLDLRPEEHTDELSARLVADVYAYLRSPQRSNPITYREPAPAQFSPSEVVSAGEHHGRFWDFVDFVFVKSRPLAFRDWVKNQLADLLQDEDLGYELERVSDATIELTDYFARDAHVVAFLTQWWTWQTTYGQGMRPDADLWQDLTRFATGLIDGGMLPEVFGRHPRRDDRIVVTPVTAIHHLPCPDPDTGLLPDPPAVCEVTSGIDHALCVKAVAADAANRALARSVPPVLVGTGLAGSRVTDRIAARAAELSAEIREGQVAQLAPEAEAALDLPLLDRLRAAVLGDTIASSHDAQRLYRVAVGDLGQLTPLRSATFWFLIGGGFIASLVILLGFGFNQDSVLEWLLTMGIAVTAEAVWAMLAITSAVLMVGPFIWYYRHLQQYLERGRRQLEARLLLFTAATTAWREHLRLRHADHLLEQWARVLTALYPCRAADNPAAPPSDEPTLPRSLQTATPSFSLAQLRRWLVTAATPRGWRSRALSEIAAAHLTDLGIPFVKDDPVGVLCRDLGLVGGSLSTLADGREEAWDRWLAHHVRQSTGTVKELVASGCAQLRPRSGPPAATAAFFERLVSDQHSAAATYAHPVQPGPSPHVDVDLNSRTAELSADVLHARTLLYVRAPEVPVLAPEDELVLEPEGAPDA